MAYEPKPGTFSLFKNDKGGNDKRPDYRGDGQDLAGNAIEVAAWLKDGGKGKFMSCTFKVKGAKPAAKPKQPGSLEEMSDDIPF